MQKRNYLTLHAITENPDLIMSTETWLNTRDKHQIAKVSILVITAFVKCHVHRKGGVVLMYARNNINVAQLSTTEMKEYDSLFI